MSVYSIPSILVFLPVYIRASRYWENEGYQIMYPQAWSFRSSLLVPSHICWDRVLAESLTLKPPHHECMDHGCSTTLEGDQVDGMARGLGAELHK